MSIQNSLNGIVGSFSALGVAKKYFDKQNEILANQKESNKLAQESINTQKQFNEEQSKRLTEAQIAANVQKQDDFNNMAFDESRHFSEIKNLSAGDLNEEQILQDSMNEYLANNPGIADLFREYGSLPTYMTEKAVKNSLDINGRITSVKTHLEQKKNGGAK